MSNNQKNLIALGVVLLSGWLYFHYDDSKQDLKKAKRAQQNQAKASKRKATADRNKSIVNMLRVSAPLLTPVINVAVDEFKARRNSQ